MEALVMRKIMAVLVTCAGLLLVLPLAVAQSDQAGKNPTDANADSGNGAAGEAGKGGAAQTALKLTDAQRQKVRAAVADDKTDITFKDNDTKDFKDFSPKLGETVPAKLPMQVMPPDLAASLPLVANYSYMKMKGQVLIVDPVTKKIVDLFPVTQS
jgi:hypothetical protein